jgi:hypothetical protein
MSLAKSPACPCASRAASARTGRRPHPHPIWENNVWPMARRQGKCYVFVGLSDLAVVRIFYQLSARLDKFYGFCSDREVSGFSSLFSPCAICLITACYPAFDQSAWLHYLRQRKAAAFSCITQKQGVMSNETRKTGSNPARGKSLTRYCSVLFLDGPNYAALFAATRHAPGEVPFPIRPSKTSTDRSST